MKQTETILPATDGNGQRRRPSNGRFGASGAVVRPKVCANLEVYRPSERWWKPRLRQAAGTLAASTTEVRTLRKEANKD